MTTSDKILFIDKIVSLLACYCPDMAVHVRFWVACQFALESNYGTSNRAIKHHNLSGMKVPRCRFSLNTSVCGVFAQYNTEYDCVLDYVLWLAYNRFTSFVVQNLDLYMARLKACKYCPDEDYIDKINKIFNQFN